jgi:two-component system, NarL family, response regulator NreC
MIKVLIADDQCMVREGLTALINGSGVGKVIGQASSGEEVLLQIEREKPDVAILEISLSGLCGIAVARKMKNRSHQPKLVFVTTEADVRIASLALDLGAVGYILKNEAFDCLANAIRAVLNNQRYITPVLAADILAFREKKKYRKLSSRESEILYYIVEGFSNREIAQKLIISVKTVDTHRSRIMKKLEVHKTAELVKMVYRDGVLL